MHTASLSTYSRVNSLLSNDKNHWGILVLILPKSESFDNFMYQISTISGFKSKAMDYSINYHIYNFHIKRKEIIFMKIFNLKRSVMQIIKKNTALICQVFHSKISIGIYSKSNFMASRVDYFL